MAKYRVIPVSIDVIPASIDVIPASIDVIPAKAGILQWWHVLRFPLARE